MHDILPGLLMIQSIFVPIMTTLYLTSTKQMVGATSQQIKKFTKLVVIHRTFVMFMTFFGKFFIGLSTRQIMMYFIVNRITNLIGIWLPVAYFWILQNSHRWHFFYHSDFIVIIGMGIILGLSFNISSVYYITYS